MNIVKLQQQLQKIPDQALIGYVQDPNSQVPSYLALAELSRRKEIRQSAAPKQPAPTQTVAQQAVAESQPGIAQLPVPDNMFNEQSMAAGGIVSFDGGGEVPRFDGRTGSFIQSLKPLTEPRDFSFKLPSFPTTEELNAYLADPQAYIANPEKYKAIAKQVGAPEKPAAIATPAPAQAQQPSVIKETPTVGDKPSSPNIPSATGGIGSLKWEDIKADTQGYRDIMRPEVSAKDKMEEMRELLGTDPARAAMQDRLAKMEARTAREEERAPAMALVEAGLGMIEGAQPKPGEASPSFLTALGRGGVQGLKSLAAAKERVNNAREKQFDIADRMSQAQRAEQVAAAKFGQESAEAIKARNDQVKLAEQSNKNEISLKNAVGKFEAQKGNAEIQLKKADLAQSAAANSAKLKMMERQILSQGLASQARLAAIRQKALAELKNNESYGLQLNAIAAKYKDSGGVQNPMYKQEVKALENEFMANALETIFDSGLGANALSADSIVPLGD
jgi:hypothetical protein